MTTDPSDDPERLVVYPSRGKTVLVILGAIAFVGIGIWIASPDVASRVSSWKVFVASYVGVPFFGACGLYAAYRLFSRRPALEIDATGITDSASALGVGHLSWGEIDYVVPYTYSGQSMLGIIPKDLEAVLSRQHGIRRRLIKMGLAMGAAPVNIPQVILPMKVQELADLLRSRYGVRVEADA